jgi:serine O-acetyltransferase
VNESPDPCREFRHHAIRGVWGNVSEDILRYLTKSEENLAGGDDLLHRVSAFATPELMCLFLYRFSHYLWVNTYRRMAVAVSRFNYLVHKVNITPQSCIGPGCRLSHPPGVTFHGRAGRGLTLFSLAVCCAEGPRFDGPVETGPRIGDRVIIGAHAVLIGPVSVGDDTRLSLGAWVNCDTPPGVNVISNAFYRKPRPNR